MREATERAIARADIVCLHLDRAYVPGQALRTQVSKSEATRIARLAEAAGGVLPLAEGTRLVLLPPADKTAEPPSPYHGEPADPAAVADHYRRAAAEMGNRLARYRIAVLVMTTCGHASVSTRRASGPTT